MCHLEPPSGFPSLDGRALAVLVNSAYLAKPILYPCPPIPISLPTHFWITSSTFPFIHCASVTILALPQTPRPAAEWGFSLPYDAPSPPWLFWLLCRCLFLTEVFSDLTVGVTGRETEIVVPISLSPSPYHLFIFSLKHFCYLTSCPLFWFVYFTLCPEEGIDYSVSCWKQWLTHSRC